MTRAREAERIITGNPERALWAEVLNHAIKDAEHLSTHGVYMSPTTCAKRQAEAIRYLTTPSRDLAMVCALAGVDMDAVIDRMRERIVKAEDPERLSGERRQNFPCRLISGLDKVSS